MVNNNEGFTLIELMVTIMIVAILVAIAIPSYQSYMVMNAEKQAQAQMGLLAVQLERWRAKALTYQGFVPYRGDGNCSSGTVYCYDNPVDPSKVRADSIIYVPTGSDKDNYRYMLELLDGNSQPTHTPRPGIRNDGRCSLNEKRIECGGPNNAGHSWIIIAYPNDNLKERRAKKMMMRSSGVRCMVTAKNSTSNSINVGSTDCSGSGVEQW